MEPQMLLNRMASSDVPAPLWFVELFKVIGFTLHLVPMNLWFAGLLVALHLYVRKNPYGRRLAERLARQMPIIVALGINFGIVPLLFLQLAYNTVFYPATILMAWFWMGVIALLIPAYYGVYLYAYGIREGGEAMNRWRRMSGWIASLFFITIGLLLANAMSLMVHLDAWPELYQKTSVAGAVSGIGHNLADPAAWSRWMLVFGLALGTTAGWTLFDSGWFAGGESPAYRVWVQRFATRLYVLSFIWAVVAGGHYIFATWPAAVREVMWRWPALPLTLLTAAAPGLPLLWLLLRRKVLLGRLEATLLMVAQVGVLALNAISRQIVQNVELGRWFKVFDQPVAPQWGALVLFLVLFVLGLLLVVWMLAQVVRAVRVEGA